MSDLLDYLDARQRQQREAGKEQLNKMLNDYGFDSTGKPIPNYQAPTPAPAAPEKSQAVHNLEDLWIGAREKAAETFKTSANAFDLVDKAAQTFSNWTGTPKLQASAKVVSFLKDAASKQAPTEEDLKNRDNFTSYLYRAIGGMPVTVGEYGAAAAAGTAIGTATLGPIGTVAGPIVGMALLGALKHSDQGVWESIKSGMIDGLTGAGLKYLEPFSRATRAVAGAATGGLLSAAGGGSPAEQAAAAVSMGGLSALAPTPKKPGAPLFEGKKDFGTPGFTPGKEVAPTEVASVGAPVAAGTIGEVPFKPDLGQTGKVPFKPDIPTGRPLPGETAGEVKSFPTPGFPPESTGAKAPLGEEAQARLKMQEDLASSEIEADHYIRQKGVGAILENVKRQTTDEGILAAADQQKIKLEQETKYGPVSEQLASKADPVLDNISLTSAKPPEEISAQVEQTAAELRITPQEVVNSLKLVDLSTTPVEQMQAPTVTATNTRSGKTETFAGKPGQRHADTIIEHNLDTNTWEIKGTGWAKGMQLTAEEASRLKDLGATMKEIKNTLMDQKGFSTFDLNFFLARTLGGAVYGFSQGDTMEDRLKNALIYGGLGAIASPKFIKAIITGMKGIDPEGIKRKEMQDKGLTPTVDQAFSAKDYHVEKMSEFLKMTNDSVEVNGRIQGINYDHINTPMDVKQVIGKMAKVYSKELSEVRDIGRSHEELIQSTERLAGTKKGDPERILNWPDGKPMTDEELLLTRMVRNDLGMGLKNETTRFINDPSQENLVSFVNTFNRYGMVQNVYGEQSTSRGKALEALKIDVGNTGEIEFHRMLGGVIDSIDPTGWTPQRLAAAINQVPDIGKLNEAMKIATRPGLNDMLLEVFYGVSMLSNPKTWAANAIGSPMALTMQVAKRTLAAGFSEAQTALGRPGVGDPNFVQPSEPLMMLKAINDSYLDAFQIAKEAFIKGERQYPLAKGGKSPLMRPPAITYDNARALAPKAFDAAESALSTMGIDAQILKEGINFLGHTARISTRLMLAPDEFNELIGSRMELYARTARSVAGEGLSLEQQTNLARARIKDMSLFSNADKEAARQFALYNTFNQEPGAMMTRLTGVVESLNKAPDQHPLWYLGAKTVVPFMTIPANISRWTAREGPLAFLSNEIKSDMAAGGARAQTAWAGVALGSMMLTVAANLAMRGVITGSPPVHKADRLFWEADGNVENGFKTPFGYNIGLSKFDPVTFPFVAAANAVNVIGHLDAYDTNTLVMTLGLSTIRTLAQKSAVQNLTDFLHAITSNDAQEINRYMQRSGGSMFSIGLLRGVREQTDPYRRTTDNVLQAMSEKTPWGSTEQPPLLDRFARPVYSGYGAGPTWVNTFGIINPVQYRANNENPILQEITKNKLTIPPINDTIAGTKDNPFDQTPPSLKNGVKLQGWEYYLFNKYSGEFLYNKFTDLVTSGKWQMLDREDKQKELNSLASTADFVAERQLRDQLPALELQIRTRQDQYKKEKQASRAQAQTGGQIAVPTQ